MSQESLKQIQINNIKDQFVQEWFEGNRPNLSAYLDKYPQFANELSEFILTFVEMQATPLDVVEVTEDDRNAMARGLASSQSKARTIVDRLKELQLDQAAFERSIRGSMDLLAEIHRHHVLSFPPKFLRLFARALELPEARSKRMLAPQALALRAESGQYSEPKTFDAIITELHSKGLLQDEDFSFWQEEIKSQ